MQVVNVHILVEYATLTGEWNTAFHWVSKRILVMWYTSGDWKLTLLSLRLLFQNRSREFFSPVAALMLVKFKRNLEGRYRHILR